MRRIQISGGLYACLLFCQLSITAMLILPRPLVTAAGQEGWLAVPAGALVGLVPTLLGVWVCVRHPGQGLAGIARTVLGKWFGGLVSMLYAALSFWIFSFGLRSLYDFLTGVLLTRTPGLVLVSSMALVVLYAIWAGLEPLARVAFQVMIVVGLGGLIVSLLCIREYSLLQREPFLYRGLGGLLQGTLLAAAWFSEGVMAMSLLPHLKEPRQAYRWTLVAFGGITLMLISLVLNSTLVMGPDLPARLVYPTFNLSEIINLGSAVERLEVFLVIIWTSGLFVLLGLFLLAAATTTTETLGLKNHRAVAVVLTIAGAWLVRIWPSPVDATAYAESPLRIGINFSILFGVPLLLAVGSLLHGRRQRRRSASA